MSALSLMQHAEMRTGLRDWGEPDFLPRMKLWLDAVRSDTGLSDAGRAGMEAMALRLACGRLRLETLIARHPEIETIALPSPIIITGLPRSGTSALATVLSRHPALHSLHYADVFEPFSGADNSRAAQETSDLAEQALPGLRRMHDTSAHAHADDHHLQALAFGGFGMEDWQAHLPRWRNACLAADHVPLYRYLKRAMQALTFLGGPARWLIKSPQHVEQLPAIKAVFPDALVVVTVRPRAAVDRSMVRCLDLIASRQRVRAVPFRYWPERFDGMQERYARDAPGFGNLIELPLAGWACDPGRTSRRIWAEAGLEHPANETRALCHSSS